MTESAVMTLFERGGPVMWPILGCSILGLAVAIHRAWAFLKYRCANRLEQSVCREAVSLVTQGRFDEAQRMTEKLKGAFGRVYHFALFSREYNLHDSLLLAAQKEIDGLRRGLSLLDTVITIAPLLGILGTVTGIISSFNMMSDTGIQNHAAVTGGIAEALITTAAGLIVAIAALLPYNYCVSWIKHRTEEMEHLTHAFETAYRKGSGA